MAKKNEKTVEVEVGRVSFSMGRTINMGNYESTRIDIGVELPFGVGPDALEAAYENAKRFVTGKLKEQEMECKL
jgi:hypothetical protein